MCYGCRRLACAMRILGDMLRQFGFEVFEAGNGREGLDRLRSTGPLDLVLVDWNMPEMNGLDMVLRRAGRAGLRADAADHGDHGNRDRADANCLESVNEYIMKPFTSDVILDKLRLLDILQDAPHA